MYKTNWNGVSFLRFSAMELEEGKEMVSASRWGGTREYKAPETSENIVGYPSDIFSTGYERVQKISDLEKTDC